MSYRMPKQWRVIPPSEWVALADLANQAIESSIQQEISSTPSGNPTEPRMIASIFVNGLKEIQTNWNSLLSKRGLHVKVSAVFCHQTPKVKPGVTSKRSSVALRKMGVKKLTTSSCELGDLLIVITNPLAKTHGNAVLLQGKKLFSRSADPLQRLLYEEAHKFEYANSGPALNGEERILMPRADGKFAYWQIGNPKPLPRKVTSCCANDWGDPLTPGLWIPFGEYLTLLASGNVGVGLKGKLTRNGWRRIVEDLVSVTHGLLLKSKNTTRGFNLPLTESASSIASQSFYVGGEIDMILESLANILPENGVQDLHNEFVGDGPPNWNMGSIESTDDDYGVSILVIECGQSF
jgi:hypothetical protein